MVRIKNIELVMLLRENSRTSYTDIAKKLKVSDTAIRKKIRRLEDTGVIKKYSIEVDPSKLGYELTCLIGVDTAPEHYIQALDKLKSMDDVISLYASSGDHMLMIEGWYKNTEELTKFIHKIESLKGVTKICPAVVHEKIK